MAANVLVRQGESKKDDGLGTVGDYHVYAMPGQIVYGNSDQGHGPILYMTPLHCIFKNENGQEVLLQWPDVLIGEVKPHPDLTMKFCAPKRRNSRRAKR